LVMEAHELGRKGLAEGLVAVAGHKELREAARVLTLALQKETNAWTLEVLAKGLAAVAGHMQPHEAAQVSAQAASILIRALEKSPIQKSEGGYLTLAAVLAEVTAWMEPREAARVSGKAASILTRALEKESDAAGCRTLVQGLADVAAWMGPREAASMSGKAASILTQALDKETNAHSSSMLAEGLVAVARRLEARQAARVLGQAASILIRSSEKQTDADAPFELAQGLAAVAAPMESREAAHILTLALEKETDAAARKELAHGLAALAARLGREEAVTVCNPGVKILLHAAETEADKKNKQLLEIALATLLSASDNVDAVRVAARVVFASYSGFDAGGLASLLADESRSQVSGRTVAAATLIGLANATPFAAMPALAVASDPLPCRLSTQELVELLKMPTCFGEARKVVLKHLGNRYGRNFANHWEFVHFAQEHHLNLDFKSPPKRWRRP
jgi:hypothetical protein